VRFQSVACAAFDVTAVKHANMHPLREGFCYGVQDARVLHSQSTVMRQLKDGLPADGRAPADNPFDDLLHLQAGVTGCSYRLAIHLDVSTMECTPSLSPHL
jgi:hypothetical protein